MNKVTLATVATSGKYSDLSGKPTIPSTTDSVTSSSTAALTSKGAYTNLKIKSKTFSKTTNQYGYITLSSSEINNGTLLTFRPNGNYSATRYLIPGDTGNNAFLLVDHGLNIAKNTSISVIAYYI